MRLFSALLGHSSHKHPGKFSPQEAVKYEVSKIIADLREHIGTKEMIRLDTVLDMCEQREVPIYSYMFEGMDLSDTIIGPEAVERMDHHVSFRNHTKLHRSVFEPGIDFSEVLMDETTQMIAVTFRGLTAETRLALTAGNISYARFEGLQGAQLELGKDVIAHQINMSNAKLAKLIIEPGADLSGANFSHAAVVEFKPMEAMV